MRFLPRDNKLFSRPASEADGNAAALAVLVTLAAAIRLYAIQHATVINVDGPLYIQQAKAVATGDWSGALCSLPFLSATPVLIRLFQTIFDDWLLAGRMVSLCFGTLALVPLHGLFRQFFGRGESLAAALLMAALPTWVSNSVDVVRDPVCWFFSLWGFYWLAVGVRRQQRPLLPLACLAFLLAAWARIEALWYPAALCLLLPLLLRRHRAASLLWFSLPLLVGAAALAAAPLLNGPSLLTMSRLGELRQNLAGGLPQYAALRADLAALRQPEQEPGLFFFLAEARNLAWLVGLGTMANRLCEASTYPFLLLALLGIGPLRRQQEQRLPLIFCLLAMGALGLLYFRVLQTWIMEYRYLMLAILPGSLCLCAGLGRVGGWLGRRSGLGQWAALALLVAPLLVISVRRDLKPRGEDDLPLKEIGAFLASHHPQSDEVRVVTSRHTMRLIRFYANQDRPGAPCPERPEHLYAAVTGDSAATLLRKLREQRIDYLVWEERNRPAGWPLDLLASDREGGVRELGRWRNQPTGEMILYQVTPGQ
ncbi:MAG: glycosyltransferase family 39 protein [Thermodesulfobacteriota bacterium]